jgi:hypothetical protein
MKLSVSLYRAASALRSSDMTYIPLFYVIKTNISDYANMLIRPSGMMLLIYFHTKRSTFPEAKPAVVSEISFIASRLHCKVSFYNTFMSSLFLNMLSRSFCVW